MASSLDDFLKGLAVFDEGMSTLGKNLALKETNQKLSNMDQALNEEEQLARKTELAQQLRSQMLGFGANAQEINSATGFAPSASAQYNAKLQEKLQENANQFRAAQFDKEAKLRKEIAGMQIKREIAKEERKEARQLKERQIPGLNIKSGFKPSKKQSEDVAKAVSSTVQMSTLLTDLKDQFEEHGFEVFNTKARGKMESTARQLESILKGEAFTNLGVLTGPDLEFLRDMIGNVDSKIGATTGIGTEAQKAKLNRVGLFTAMSIAAKAESSGYTLDPNGSLAKFISEAGIPTDTMTAAKTFMSRATEKQSNAMRRLLLNAVDTDKEVRQGAIKRLQRIGIPTEGF